MIQTFGNAVRGARFSRRMTQEDLAEAAGTSVRTIQNLEKGSVCINWTLWIKICLVLEIDFSGIIKQADLPKNCGK